MIGPVFALLVACAVFPPVVTVAGPLSLDDVLPLIAVSIGLVASLRTRRFPIDATVIGFVLLMLAGILSSTVHAEGLGDLLRMIAKSAGRVGFYLVLVVTARLLLRGPAAARLSLVIVASVATLEALFSLGAYAFAYRGPFGIGVTEFSRASALAGGIRVQGTFGAELAPFQLEVAAANFLAAYLMMALLISVALALEAERRAKKIAWVLAALVQLGALLLTYTRASLMALGAGMLAMGWLMEKKRLALAVLVAGVLSLAIVPSLRAKVFDPHDRFVLWTSAARVIADHPFAGIGEGNHEQVVFSSQDYMDTPWGAASSTAHNSVLQSAVHHGVAGGVAHVLLYLLAGVVAVRSIRRTTGRARFLAAGIGAALFGYLCQDQFNNLMYVPKVATQAWFLFALLSPLSGEE